MTSSAAWQAHLTSPDLFPAEPQVLKTTCRSNRYGQDIVACDFISDGSALIFHD